MQGVWVGKISAVEEIETKEGVEGWKGLEDWMELTPERKRNHSY